MQASATKVAMGKKNFPKDPERALLPKQLRTKLLRNQHLRKLMKGVIINYEAYLVSAVKVRTLFR